jgi:hypothetical protein
MLISVALEVPLMVLEHAESVIILVPDRQPVYVVDVSLLLFVARTPMIQNIATRLRAVLISHLSAHQPIVQAMSVVMTPRIRVRFPAVHRLAIVLIHASLLVVRAVVAEGAEEAAASRKRVTQHVMRDIPKHRFRYLNTLPASTKRNARYIPVAKIIPIMIPATSLTTRTIRRLPRRSCKYASAHLFTPSLRIAMTCLRIVTIRLSYVCRERESRSL